MTRMDEAPTSEETVTVTVKVFGALREALGTGAREMALSPGATLGDLLRQLGADLPELTAKLDRGLRDGYLHALVNGRNARFLQDRETPLKLNDTVAFLPPVGGG